MEFTALFQSYIKQCITINLSYFTSFAIDTNACRTWCTCLLNIMFIPLVTLIFLMYSASNKYKISCKLLLS